MSFVLLLTSFGRFPGSVSSLLRLFLWLTAWDYRVETDGRREAHTGLEAAIQMRCFLWWVGDGKSLFVRNSSAWRSLFITQARKTSPLHWSAPGLTEVTGKKIALLCMLMGTVRNDKKCRALLEPGSNRLLSCGPFPFSSSLLKTGAARQKHLGNPSRSLLQLALTTSPLSVHALLLTVAGIESIHLRC